MDAGHISNDPRPLQGIGRTDGPGSPPGPATDAAGTSPSFQALLERLQQRANELAETSEVVDDAERLAGAVDTARASLEDALSLSDRLLEAYRQAAQQVDGPPDGPPHGESGTSETP